MHHLKNRSEFLKQSKEKIDRDIQIEQRLSKISESTSYGSGPFANDIPWGDSLLGRLVNAAVRRARITVNMARIQGPIRQLKNAMEELLDFSVVNSYDEEQIKEFTKLKMWTFVSSIVEAIEKGYKVKIIKNTTDATIDEIEKMISEKKGFFNEAELTKLLEQLKDFRKFLDDFDDNEGENAPGISEEDLEDGSEGGEEGDEADEADEGENVGDTGMDPSTIYMTLVKNMSALSRVLGNFYLKDGKVESKVKIEGTKSMSSVSKPYVTKEGDTLTSISQSSLNVKRLPANKIKSLNQQVMYKGKTQPLSGIKNSKGEFIQNAITPLPAGIELKFEGFLFSFESFTQTFEAIGDGGGQQRNKITSEESHLSQAFTKLKKDVGVLISDAEKGIGVSDAFIKAITDKRLEEGSKQKIKDLYAEILEFLVGSKKSTMPEKDKLYESLDIISDKNKLVIVAEKIARFTKRALQFDNENLYGGLGDLGKPLQEYVETMNLILKIKPEDLRKKEVKKEEKKEGKIPESKLFSYQGFINKVNEAEETDEGDVSEPSNSPLKKIKDYFYKKVDVKTYMIEESQVNKIRTNLEKVEGDAKKGKMTIGMDPILRIVRAFNRAYKIHTTKVIPNVGTSDGRVAASVFNQYTCFGDGTKKDAGLSGGPYRNNALFNTWEKAVQDIKGNTEYQKIFRGDTELKTPEGKIIKDAGKNLLKFMNDMLDGESLYKSSSRGSDGGQGKQAEFIDRYFGYKVEDPKQISESTGGKLDTEENTNNALKIPMVSLLFTDQKIEFKDASELVGTFFSATVKVREKMKTMYFLIHGFDSSFVYLSYCESFSFFKQYLRVSGVSPDGSLKGKLPSLEEGTQTGNEEYRIKGAKFKNDLINPDGSFKIQSDSYEISFILRFGAGKNNISEKPSKSSDPDKIKFEGPFFTLAEKKTFRDKPGVEEFKRFKLKSVEDAVQKTQKGFKNLVSDCRETNLDVAKKV